MMRCCLDEYEALVRSGSLQVMKRATARWRGTCTYILPLSCCIRVLAGKMRLEGQLNAIIKELRGREVRVKDISLFCFTPELNLAYSVSLDHPIIVMWQIPLYW